MAKTLTQWDVSALDIIRPPCQEALLPYIEAGQTGPVPTLIYGPDGGIPEGQYVCERTWTSVALAQNWLDIIDTIAASTGTNCLNKVLVE